MKWPSFARAADERAAAAHQRSIPVCSAQPHSPARPVEGRRGAFVYRPCSLRAQRWLQSAQGHSTAHWR
eukprot:CAMPEP_0168456352 /NCGR_PEP_ID=MMETSP0228-20121227/51246_1 /TAXON_ID=133427 /ORGANISM="Protoceratium reticulatum, Strain CCCM 535 (=CCMP 1889)" /LENGTH=68 /DNA_ID=CAMNT_0008471275 /DNA_START=48 /DNA_END=251 /DNA_ORIENTATION=-